MKKISVMTIQARDPDSSAGEQAAEIANRLTNWINENFDVRIINIETIVSKTRAGSNFKAPYEGERMEQYFRIWYQQ